MTRTKDIQTLTKQDNFEFKYMLDLDSKNSTEWDFSEFDLV